MFTFVDCDAHPVLAEMTDYYRRLERLNAVAAQASADERRFAKEWQELPKAQREVPRVPIQMPKSGGISSVDWDFTDPARHGYSVEAMKRMAKHASAVLAARASYEPLYKAAAEMQSLMAKQAEKHHEVRQNNAPRLWDELHYFNSICAKQLLKTALSTLASFSDTVSINDHDGIPVLSSAETNLVSNFSVQWNNWFRNLPTLPTQEECPEMRERDLLVRCLAAGDNQELDEKTGWICGRTRVHRFQELFIGKVLERLRAKGWYSPDRGPLAAPNEEPAEAIVSRRHNSHAPDVRRFVKKASAFAMPRLRRRAQV